MDELPPELLAEILYYLDDSCTVVLYKASPIFHVLTQKRLKAVMEELPPHDLPHFQNPYLGDFFAIYRRAVRREITPDLVTVIRCNVVDTINMQQTQKWGQVRGLMRTHYYLYCALCLNSYHADRQLAPNFCPSCCGNV